MYSKLHDAFTLYVCITNMYMYNGFPKHQRTFQVMEFEIKQNLTNNEDHALIITL